MNDYEKIIQIALQNQNMFKTKMVVDAGIRKERIKELLEQEKIVRIGHGFYTLRENRSDKYFELQQRCPKAIFSYATSAYLLGLLEQAPAVFDCTVPRGYNTSRLNLNEKVQYHYVLEEYYPIGLTEYKTPYGTTVQIYDRERTICDFVKHRRKIDPQLYSAVLNAYFKSREKEIRKLARYGRIFHVIKELEMYMEVL